MRPERAWSDLVAIFAPSYAVQELYIEDWLIAVICEAHMLACSWRENGGHGVVRPNIGPISRMSFSIYSYWPTFVFTSRDSCSVLPGVVVNNTARDTSFL